MNDERLQLAMDHGGLMASVVLEAMSERSAEEKMDLDYAPSGLACA